MKSRTSCKTRCHSYCLTVSVTVKAASYTKLFSQDNSVYTIGARTHYSYCSVYRHMTLYITNQPN